MGAAMTVRHEPDRHRFVTTVDGRDAVLTYTQTPGRISFNHTGVPDGIGGRGVGSALVRVGLDFARDAALTVEPRCWFVRGWMDRHPEYLPLLSPAARR